VSGLIDLILGGYLQVYLLWLLLLLFFFLLRLLLLFLIFFLFLHLRTKSFEPLYVQLRAYLPPDE
jgi:hypothetical protein